MMVPAMGWTMDVDQELFLIQCRVLALGTDTRLTAKQLRDQLMVLRDEIIKRRTKLRKQELTQCTATS